MARGRLWKGTTGPFFLITGANTVNTAAAGTRAHVRTELVWQTATGAGIRLLFKDLCQRSGKKTVASILATELKLNKNFFLLARLGGDKINQKIVSL